MNMIVPALPEDHDRVSLHTILGELNLVFRELSKHKILCKIVTCQRNYKNQVGYFRITAECHTEMVDLKGYYLFVVLDKQVFYNARIVKADDVYYTNFIRWDMLMTEVDL